MENNLLYKMITEEEQINHVEYNIHGIVSMGIKS